MKTLNIRMVITDLRWEEGLVKLSLIEEHQFNQSMQLLDNLEKNTLRLKELKRFIQEENAPKTEEEVRAKAVAEAAQPKPFVAPPPPSFLASLGQGSEMPPSLTQMLMRMFEPPDPPTRYLIWVTLITKQQYEALNSPKLFDVLVFDLTLGATKK